MAFDEILAAARAHAGEEPLTIAHLLGAAIDASTWDVGGPLVRTMLDRAAPAGATPLSDPELADLRRRAAALAVALDHGLRAEHVVVVASLHPHAGDPAALGLLRQLALGHLVGPDPEAFTSLSDRLRDEAAGGQRVELASERFAFPLHPVASAVPSGEAPGARCAVCRGDLDGHLRRVSVADTEGTTVVVLACTRCGAVVASAGPN